MASSNGRKRPSLDTSIIPESKRPSLDTTGTTSTSTTASSITRPPPKPSTEQRTNKPAPKPLSPLYVACLNGHYKVVKKLLDHGEPADSHETNTIPGNTPLIAACINGHVDIVELILNRGAKVNLQNNEGRSALMVASLNGHRVIVNLLIDKGAEVNMRNNKGWSALMKASQNGHSVVVNLLIDKGAEVNMQDNEGNSALMLASENGHSDTVNLLIDKGAEVNMQDNGWSALMVASHNGHSDVVNLLIDKGAEVNMQDNEEWSALMAASDNGHSDTVNLLIDKGAEVNMQNNDGWSALMIASESGHSDIINLLIDKGAEVNMQDNDGWSALMVASQNGHSDVVNLLIDKGAEVNMQDNDGWSALIAACFKGRLETVRLLIENHADTSLQDIRGRTALGLACEQGHTNIVSIFYPVKEQEEMDNSGASIQEESSEARRESCIIGKNTSPLANKEATNDHAMTKNIDRIDPDIKTGCHGNHHKQIIKPVTTDKANKDGASDSSPDVPELSQLELLKELKVVTDPLQLGIGLETIEKENKQADASGPSSGPHRHRDRLTTVDGDCSSHPANGGHHGQPQLPGASSCGIADSPPSNSDRPSSVKGDASSTTKRYIPESTQHEHQLGMKLTIEQLKKRCNLTDEQLQRAIRDGELFNVAYLFEGWSEYVDTPGLGLTRGEQAQIRSDLTLVTNVMRMKEALRIWKSKNPFAATFLSLLNILLALKTQGDLARKICEHLKIGDKQELISDPAVEHISKDLVLFKEKPIGGGAFGTVFKGELHGEPCAVKLLHALAAEIRTSIPTAKEAKQDSVERFRQECEYLESFHHPNIVCHLATRHHPKTNHLVLALELMDCNLRQFFKRQSDQDRRLSIPTQKSLCHNIASALAYIHSRGVVHRDLCSDNILLDCKGENPVAKVCDFGMSRIIKSEGTSISLPTLGHRGYLPPEATDLESTRYDSSFDIFSFGAIMVQIIRHMPTIKDRKDRTYHLKKISSTHLLKPLIDDCLQENRDDRPSASRLEKELAQSP